MDEKARARDGALVLTLMDEPGHDLGPGRTVDFRDFMATIVSSPSDLSNWTGPLPDPLPAFTTEMSISGLIERSLCMGINSKHENADGTVYGGQSESKLICWCI